MTQASQREPRILRVELSDREWGVIKPMLPNMPRGVRATAPTPSDPNFYRLTVIVHDKSNGHCLWQGEARHPVEGADQRDTARRLVPVVLGHLGKTIAPTPFAFDD